MEKSNNKSRVSENDPSKAENFDEMSDDEVKAFMDELGAALQEANRAIRGRDLFMGEELRKKRWQRRKDRRIIECHRNATERGRGKFVFIITTPTFEQIIQYIEKAGGHAAAEVVSTLYAMFYDGANFDETDPQVSRKTVNRQLRSAFRALDIFIGDWKQPSLWTIKISHRMLKDAEEADVDLGDWFLVV